MRKVRLTLALLLLGCWMPGLASAFAVTMTHRNPGFPYPATSDVVILDVFLDAEPGLVLFSVGVLFEDTWYDYDPVASAALPASGAAGPGAQPSYILYTPGGGPGSPATILYPLQTPAFLEWPAPPPGLGQVNLNYSDPAFNPAAASGTGIWIGSLAFHVAQGGIVNTIFEVTVTGGGNAFFQNGEEVDPGTISLSSPVFVPLPEPNAAVLILTAFVAARVAFRARRGT